GGAAVRGELDYVDGGAVGHALAGEGAEARTSRGGGAGGGGGAGRGGRGRPAPGVPAAAGGGDQNQGEERGRTHRPSIRTRRAGGRPRLKFLPAPARSPLRVRELRRLGRRSAALLQVGHVVGLVAVRLDLAALDRLLELALHVADAARGRDAERLHDGVAEPGRQRRHPRVLLAQALDPPLQLAYLPEQELAPAGALGGDVGAGQVEQVLQVRLHLAGEPAHRAVGPRLAVLVRAQVVLDEEAHLDRHLALERDAAQDLVEHARAHLGVAVEVDAAPGEGAGRDLADVVQERRP